MSWGLPRMPIFYPYSRNKPKRHTANSGLKTIRLTIIRRYSSIERSDLQLVLALITVAEGHVIKMWALGNQHVFTMSGGGGGCVT